MYAAARTFAAQTRENGKSERARQRCKSPLCARLSDTTSIGIARRTQKEGHEDIASERTEVFIWYRGHPRM